MDVLKTLYELVKDLILSQDKRRREMFSESIKPLFDSFMEFHTEYYHLFMSTIRSLPDQLDLGEWEMPGDYRVTNDMTEVKECVVKVKRAFLDKREENEPFRDQLREDAREVLLAVKHPEEKRFLLTLIYYFLDEGGVALDDSALDTEVEVIEEEGGISALETPSSRLALKLYKTDDPQQLKEAVEEALDELNKRFSDVCTSYTKLRLTIQQETSPL